MMKPHRAPFLYLSTVPRTAGLTLTESPENPSRGPARVLRPEKQKPNDPLEGLDHGAQSEGRVRGEMVTLPLILLIDRRSDSVDGFSRSLSNGIPCCGRRDKTTLAFENDLLHDGAGRESQEKENGMADIRGLKDVIGSEWRPRHEWRVDIRRADRCRSNVERLAFVGQCLRQPNHPELRGAIMAESAEPHFPDVGSNINNPAVPLPFHMRKDRLGA